MAMQSNSGLPGGAFPNGPGDQPAFLDEEPSDQEEDAFRRRNLLSRLSQEQKLRRDHGQSAADPRMGRSSGHGASMWGPQSTSPMIREAEKAVNHLRDLVQTTHQPKTQAGKRLRRLYRLA